MMAEGGIQAATKGWKDSPYYHYLDIMGGGHFTNKPELVKTLAYEAPDVMRWLLELGCNFSKDSEGILKTMHGGGTSRKRMHYAADITGAEMMRTVRDEARNRADDIQVIEFSPAVELILNDKGHCAGAVLYNMETAEYLVVKAKSVVMATGGSGRLHVQNFMTTNHYGATGDGIVMAYRAGVPVCFLHTIQYHPTGVVFPNKPREFSSQRNSVAQVQISSTSKATSSYLNGNHAILKLHASSANASTQARVSRPQTAS
jgi:succinate dehydrogenase/fumarate reductase flavoprotein subunit